MCKEKFIFVFAGGLNLAGLALGHWVSPWFLLISAFVGVNMLQAGLTNWCLMTKILNKMKMPNCTEASPTM